MILHSNIIGQGQPFIILHGFLGMSDNWKTLGRKFSEQGYEVHLVDQRNHGRSPHDAAFNYEVLIRDLEQYCDSYKLSNIVLLGHSMGGKVSMLFAAKYPQIVSKLIVADISPRYYPVHHQTILEGLSALNLDVLTSRKEADEVLANYVSEFGTRQFLLKNLYWVEKGKFALRVNLKVLKDNVEEIGEALPTNSIFKGDTLFLRGDKSDYILEQDETLIKIHFPNSVLVTINNAGHWLHTENPDTFFESLVSFL